MFISTNAAFATWSSSDARSPSHPKRPMKQSTSDFVRHSRNTLPPTPSREPAFQMISPAMLAPSAADCAFWKSLIFSFGMISIALALPRRLPLSSMKPTTLLVLIASSRAAPSMSAHAVGQGLVVGEGNTSEHDVGVEKGVLKPDTWTCHSGYDLPISALRRSSATTS